MTCVRRTLPGLAKIEILICRLSFRWRWGAGWDWVGPGVQHYKTMGDNPLCWVTQPGYMSYQHELFHIFTRQRRAVSLNNSGREIIFVMLWCTYNGLLEASHEDDILNLARRNIPNKIIFFKQHLCGFCGQTSVGQNVSLLNVKTVRAGHRLWDPIILVTAGW